MAFCSQCGADVTGVTFCAKCGAPVEGAASSGGEAAAAPPPGAGTQAAPSAGAGSQDNVMGALAYVTIIPAIIFLVIEPYNKNPFVRFHAFQCLFFAGTMITLNIANMILGMIPFIGFLTIVSGMLIFLGGIGVWALLVFKAYSGEKFKLPVIGDLAEKQAQA